MDSEQLSRRSAVAGRVRQTVEETAGQPLVSGRVLFERDYAGLMLHISDALELQNASTLVDLPPTLGVSVVFEGRLRFRLDDESHLVGPDSAKRPRCFAINTVRPGTLERYLQRGNRVKKVNISIDPHWLESQLDPESPQDRYLLDFATRHGQVRCFRPSARLVKLAGDLLQSSEKEAGVTAHLNRESLCLAFAAEALRVLGAHLSRNRTRESAGEPAAAPAGKSVRAMRVKKYLETRVLKSDAKIPVRLPDIARQLGMSTSQMQRVFKSCYGKTVVDYIRLRRLEMAREKLLTSRASIGEVAFSAGYNHTPNFALAFKKNFGISPGALRASHHAK